ncbi:MAG: hypothetical protein C4529_03450 [Deltaproteobacteria bacterium]|nr:MAG: hypothetical protein C4529_03450 [Deltaproteobacteria bacterium]
MKEEKEMEGKRGKGMRGRRTDAAVVLVAVLVASAIALRGAPVHAQFDPGGIPHYFGPHPNWAYSPAPKTVATGTPATVGNPLIDRAYATDFATPAGTLGPVLVVVPAALPAGTLSSVQTWNQASAGGSPTPSAGGVFHAYVLRPTGTPNQYSVVHDSGLLAVPALPAGSAGQVETFPMAPGVAVQAGDVIAFYGEGIPVDTGAGADILCYPSPSAPVAGGTITLDSAGGFPVYPQARTYSISATVDVVSTSVTGGIRKFVDNVALLGPGGANNLGQYLPVAVADKSAFPGPSPPASDYYEIGLVEYYEKMHSDLPPTKHRGYVQLETTANAGVSKHVPLPNGYFAVDAPHFLGPVIVARRDVPVRIKFVNLLPTGEGGNLFLPVDNTVMGAGLGPKDAMGMDCNPMMPMAGMPCEKYAENRATLHLHGNNTVWISDGTPHQWTTPAGETTQYPKGVSVVDVPDMAPAENGALTFYYSNAHSARLMFYHDHSYGITRLNVYAGEAAAYLVTDAVEQDLIDGTNTTGVNPGLAKVLPDLGIPLVIQDRTFVDNTTIADQDPTWNWGTGPRDPATGKIQYAVTGDLWYPHVYMPAQNPWNPDWSGMNTFGRWHYAAWFWPTPVLAHPPVPNEYYDPCGAGDVDGVTCASWEPPWRPDIPNPSSPGEGFMDTPIVNGTAYPYLEVEPKSYRFRILNAADDRFFNLQMYVAADKSPVAPPALPALCDGTVPVENCTEVRMVPAIPTPEYPEGWPTDGRVSGVPDPASMGPGWIQIGTEGGFLPKPVAIPNQPVDWNLDPTTFNMGNVSSHSLLLGTAERADVIVDFSAYAGKTLILYNDAPAAFPAADARYDYYTGNPDLTATGGAPSTLPGYGPNIRTIMQIRVKNTAPAASYDLAALEAAFAKNTATGKLGVFEVSQDEIIVPHAEYDSAYDRMFPGDTFVRQFQSSHIFPTLAGPTVNIPLQPKAIQDEMGEVFDQHGRMMVMLGLQKPPSQPGAQNFMMYGYASPPVEIVKGSVVGSQIGSADDGTQIWMITHNGVDTHTIHTHLFNAQLVNRIGWDGALIFPDSNELGWKETFRVNPLEHTILALRPFVPNLVQVPFQVPNSVRLIDPTLPEGAELMGGPGGFFDTTGQPVQVFNKYVNFGWEYVYHCHLLAHEEMDMMHSVVFGVPPPAPSGLATALLAGPQRVDLTWTDASVNETEFIVQRAADAAGPWTTLATVPSVTGASTGTQETYTDAAVAPTTTYYYRVIASNTVGDTTEYPAPVVGFPSMTLGSTASAVASVTTVTPGPASPTGLAAAILARPARIRLTWTDASNDETRFAVWRSANGGAFVPIATVGRSAAQSAATGGTVAYVNNNTAAAPLVPGTTYRYYVTAANALGASAPSNTATVEFFVPAAPTGLTGSAVRIPRNNSQDRATLRWTDNANNETGFTIQRSLFPNFRFPSTYNVGANVTTFSQNVSRAFNFYYRVRATNAVGNSGWSNTVFVTTP